MKLAHGAGRFEKVIPRKSQPRSPEAQETEPSAQQRGARIACKSISLTRLKPESKFGFADYIQTPAALWQTPIDA